VAKTENTVFFRCFFSIIVVVKPVECQWWISVYYHKCYYVYETCNHICRSLGVEAKGNVLVKFCLYVSLSVLPVSVNIFKTR